MQIELEPGARPVNVRRYRLTPKEQEALLTKVDEFVARGWIEPSVSAWNSPVLFVPKPNGSLKFCVDFRFINRCRLYQITDRSGTVTSLRRCARWQVCSCLCLLLSSRKPTG